MREIMSRRIGPLPVWVYFVILVLGGVLFLRWRSGKDGVTPQKDATNLTDQPSTLVPYTSDVFVTVQQPAGPGGTPMVGRRPIIPTSGDGVIPRRTSVTYPIGGNPLAGFLGGNNAALYQANRSTVEAIARQHGISSVGSGSAYRIYGSERLVMPT